MKKNYFLLLCSLLLGVTIHAQVSYTGNGNTSFGDVVGNGGLNISDNGTTISFSFTKGGGNLNNHMVIYIDSKSGGFSDTSLFTDSADGGRRAVSGFDGTNRSTVNFPAGFTADYAISMEQNFAGLFELTNSGSHTFVASANLSPTGTTTATTYTFDIDFTEIGTTAVENFNACECLLQCKHAWNKT
mgnify:CR=1 FL=1